MSAHSYANSTIAVTSAAELALTKAVIEHAAPGSELSKRSVKEPQVSRWRSFWAKRSMMEYHRLFVLVLAANIAVAAYGFGQWNWWTPQQINVQALGNMVIGNFALAILIRQHYVVNFLFWLATRAPTSFPLAIRRRLGKVYHFGGFHSGGATAGSLWYMAFLGAIAVSWLNGDSTISDVTLGISAGLMVLLLTIVVMALPKIRSRLHNYFELTHRLGGWSALVLFWAQFLSMTFDQNGSDPLLLALTGSPNFWLLTAITVSIALPWLRLKKVPVSIVRPSNHVALATFDYGVTPFAGSSTALSRSPLTEWHSFANIPAPGQSGFRLAISRAGDWTGQFVDDLPSHVWVKAIPAAGVGNIDQLFKRVIWVATGSGVAPCVPHLLSQETPSRLVWSTRKPEDTFGDEFVKEILDVQPDAVIWDTTSQGKPDLVQLALDAYIDFDAEAVICISNEKLTWQIVTAMESRGIPAYGAIWDS